MVRIHMTPSQFKKLAKQGRKNAIVNVFPEDQAGILKTMVDEREAMAKKVAKLEKSHKEIKTQMVNLAARVIKAEMIIASHIVDGGDVDNES